jgi:hypothetical protein
VVAKSYIILLAILQSFQLLASGWRVNVNQDKLLKLKGKYSSFLAELPLSHIFSHRFGQKFGKNGNPRISGRIFGKVPVSVVAFDVDGRLII